MKKEGPAYDLTPAMGILSASEKIKSPDLESYILMEELVLDGSLKPIKGVLPTAIRALEENFSNFILQKQNFKEAAIVKGLAIYVVEHFSDVINHFDKNITLENIEFTNKKIEL